jgi:hypothetical protein
MKARDRIYQRLAASVPLSVFVLDRVYSGRAPDAPVYPCVVIQQISEVPEVTLDGWSRISQFRYQVDAWARETDEAFEIASAVVEALEGTDDYITKVIFAGRREDFDSSVKVHRVACDFIAWVIDNATSD